MVARIGGEVVSVGDIVVYGASGHTGRFVVAELGRRGHAPILAGRDAAALRTLGDATRAREVRVAEVDDAASLDRALAGAAAVINCAGPFVDTVAPIVDAALRAGAHYLDVCAEQATTIETFERHAERAREAGLVVAPSMAFYGGLGDLLATVAMGDWHSADEIRIGIALDSWQPTRGTRLTVQRNAGRHFVYANGRFETPDAAPVASPASWGFPEPHGSQAVTALSTADQVTISRHLRVPEIRAYINLAPLKDLRDPETPAPVPVDEYGRSSQTFVVDVRARRDGVERRAMARGRDIYAVTAPIVVEAVERVLDGRFRTAGAVAAGETFDAAEFLQALSPEHLSIEA